MTAWSYLPNAKHIDAIIASVKANPEVWGAAWRTVVGRNAAWDAARNAAWKSAWNAAWDAAWNAARGAAREAAWEAARDAAWYATRNAARGGILALVAYDHASRYLEMKPDQLHAWALLSEDPAAVLLIPAVIAFDKLAETETA